MKVWPAILAVVVNLTACTGLIFHPLKEHLNDPAQLGIEARDVYFATPDGPQLHGWFLPAQKQEKGTVFFLHGNAENISTHLGSVWWLPRHGFNLFLFDYRGYGYSEGEPNLPGLQTDIESGLVALFAMEEIDSSKVIVYGQSLGAALAIPAVVNSSYRDRIRGVVVEGGFPSYRRMAREKFGDFWLTWPLQWPLSLTVSDAYRPIDFAPQLSPIPLLVIHGARDQVIPLRFGRKLYDAAKSPKQLWIVEDATHISTLNQESNRDRFVGYLDRMVSAEGLAKDF